MEKRSNRKVVIIGTFLGCAALAACSGGGGGGGGNGGNGGPPPAPTPGSATVTILPGNPARGQVVSGAQTAMLVAISGAGDQNQNGQTGTFATTSLQVGSGSQAQSVARTTMSLQPGAAAPLMQWDRPRDDKAIASLMRTFKRASTTAGAITPQTSTIPSNPTVGTTVANIWADVGGYKQFPATLEAQTQHGNVWIDNTLMSGPTSTSAFNSANVLATATSIANALENGYTSDAAHFGSPDYPSNAPGIQTVNSCDQTGKVIGTTPNVAPEPADRRVNVLVLNNVGGYFSGVNLLTQAALNCSVSAGAKYSNEAPVLYVGWFNTHPDLELGEDIPRSTAHQLQHLINFVNHFVMASTPAPEELWINEGLSELSQDLAIQKMYSSTPFDLDTIYHISQYLAAPQNFSLSGFIGIDAGAAGPAYNCAGCYGGAYLFQRYLYDRFGGDKFSQAMENSGKTGFANLEATCGCNETSAQLMQDFAISLGVSALGLKAPASQPQYSLGSINVKFGQYPTPVAAYTTQPLNGFGAFTLGTNASTTITAPLGGFAFVTLSSPSGENVSINDTTPLKGFNLTAALIQH